MHDAGRVDDRQRGGDALREIDEVGDVERPVLAHPLEQRDALDVLHHEVRPRAVEVGVEHLGDVRALDPAQRSHLALQADARGLVFG
ncbi:hypothetical protein GCM10020001_020530 [Nonomuraea salmonea]